MQMNNNSNLMAGGSGGSSGGEASTQEVIQSLSNLLGIYTQVEVRLK
jgi:hypothetical protein